MHELMQRISRSDQSAFAELYGVCIGRLRRYLAGVFDSEEDIDDVLQETFLRLARARERLAEVKDPVKWVFTVAHNEAQRRLSRREREYKRCPDSLDGLEEIVPEEEPGADEDPRFGGVAADARLAVTMLHRIPEEVDWWIVVMRTTGGFSYRKIAELTNLPQGTVVTRCRSLLARLKKWYMQELKQREGWGEMTTAARQQS